MRDKRVVEKVLKRFPTLVLATIAWCAGSVAAAQDFCEALGGVLVAAQTEFAGITGLANSGDWPAHLAVFEATQSLPGAGTCVIAQQSANGSRFSTSYTCANLGEDSDVALQSLQQQLRQCLDLTEWSVQSENGALSSSFGLIRLSITRNGAPGGLALGIEVFRDERGEVMGSPMRGNRVEENGRQRCTPKSAQEIADYIAMYGARPGAERFESREFIGFTNQQSSPIVAFATRPAHPAHPAIITRDVYERDGSRYATASGDFAGDCEAFHALLREVQAMNRNLGRN